MPTGNFIFDLARFNVSSDWTILGDETDALADSTNTPSGLGAITFGKADATATTTYAGIYRTVDLDLIHSALAHLCSEDRLVVSFYVGALTDIAQLEVRIGTDASHHNVWVIDDSAMTASTWQSLSVKWGTCSVTGNGMDPSNIDYMAVAVKFDAQDKELAGIIIDRVYLLPNTATVS